MIEYYNLPSFSTVTKAKCAACGEELSKIASTTFIERKEFMGLGEGVVDVSVMRVSCSKCGYQSLFRPLFSDSKKTRVDVALMENKLETLPKTE